jgi:hypothetical protein
MHPGEIGLSRRTHFAAALPAACLLAAASAAAPAHAETRQGFDLAVEGYYYRYEETVSGRYFMDNTGGFLSVGGGYTRKFGDAWLHGGLRYGYGSVDYNSAGTGRINGVDNHVFDVRLTGGYDVRLSETVTLAPLAGLGFRYLLDRKGNTVSTTGASGYDRESQYLYVPLGARLDVGVADGWTLSPSAQVNLMVYGHQTSHLSDVAPGFSDVENDQPFSYGIEAALMATKEVGGYTLSFGPFVRWWDIGASNTVPLVFNGRVVAAATEPANTTVEAGAHFTLGF